MQHSSSVPSQRWRQRRFAAKPRRITPKNKPSEIAASRFINKAISPTEDAPYAAMHTFHDFGLSDRMVATLDHIGYQTPSPIQDQTIVPGLAGKDVIGLANTGTGKTAAFLLPMIEHLAMSRQAVGALVLAPTRELAQQIDSEFRRFAAGQKLYSTLVVGGVNMNRQIQDVKRGPHIIIGTPGRIKDLIDRRVLRLSTVTMFVLDEADRMCDMGFVRDIRTIESELPRQRQTFCFSATMTPEVKVIVEEFMHDPLTVSVIKNETNDHIEQDVIYARDKAHKIELLTELLGRESFEKTIVFCGTKYFAERLAKRLTAAGFPSMAIHGNKSQGQRERALRAFKQGDVAILVATDVAARGLDIPDVSHVINFDAPKQYEDYVHRIGRTGRAGKAGMALTFVSATTEVPGDTPEVSRRSPRRTPQASKSQTSASHQPPKHRRRPSGAVAEDRLVNLINGL